jgi:signal transduction histidine kinase
MRRATAGRWLALTAATIGLPLAVLTALGTLYWPGRVFPGFFVLDNLVVPTVDVYGWTGMKSGVPFHSRVLTADDHPMRTNADVYAYVAALPEGTPVHWELAKGSETLVVTVPTMRFGTRDYWLTVGLFVVNGFLALGAGLVVGLLQPSRPDARAFLLFGFFVALFALTGTAVYHPDLAWLTPLHLVSQVAFPAAFIHFALVFPVERRVVARQPAWLAAPYLIAALLAAWTIPNFSAIPPDLTPLYISYLYSALAIVVMIVLLAYAAWENRTPLVRPRLQAVLPALIVATAGGLFGFLNTANRGGDFPINLVAITPVAFYLSVGYAVAKYDLFEIDVLLRRTLLYTTLTLAITATYALALVALGLVLPAHLVQASPIFNVAFVVLVAFLFQPLRTAVQQAIDRLFYRGRPDYRRTVGEVSAALTSLLYLDEILGRVGHAVIAGLHVRSLAVLLAHETGTRAWRYDERSGRMEEMTAHCDALLEHLARAREPWITDDGGDEPAASAELADLPPAVREQLRRLDAALLVPLVLGRQLIGAFALGRKRSGLAFSGEDLDLLRTLAAQGAIAVQNAISYQSLQLLNQELEAKVRHRTAELQASNSELERAYRELQAAHAQVLHTEKMASLGQLVAGVAHEINNPVSFIVGNIEPLRERLRSLRALAARHDNAELARTVDAINRAFDIIARGAERTAGIVNDLRTFSRVGEALPRPVDIRDGIEVSLRLLRPRWADRITIHRDYGELPPMEAAPGQLNQVFMNLLANACDAIAGSGNIWITTASDGTDLAVTVRDDGVGIPAENLPRIFDPFFTTKPHGKGTGIGLAISHGIVAAHGGRIEVSSRPGEGTIFRVVFPVGAPATVSAAVAVPRR